jgi:hypothetical protein
MAYAACFYIVGRAAWSAEARRIADVLFAGWLASILFDAGIGGEDGLLFRIGTDAVMAFALARGGALSRRVTLWFVPMLVLNAGLYVGRDPMGLTMTILNLTAWAQMVTLLAGIWGDGLGQIMGGGVRGVRDRLLDLAAFSRVAKGEER